MAQDDFLIVLKRIEDQYAKMKTSYCPWLQFGGYSTYILISNPLRNERVFV